DIGAYEFQRIENSPQNFDGDLDIDSMDLFVFGSGWHMESGPSEDQRNFNGDFSIDSLDLLDFLHVWGVE
ncbi:MAG: hypothetical protein KC931_24750, partial [Candidatus Omnitrophica bacterium]|nr:hypothetical protein [Candidatus Omnitrophota bacterium]